MKSIRAQSILTVIAGASGLIVAIGVYGLTSPRRSAQSDPAVPTVLAAMDLSPGLTLAETHLKSVLRPMNGGSGGDFTQIRSVVGRVVEEPIAADAPILESALLPPGQRVAFRHRMPAGYRAIRVPAGEIGAVQDLLQPADRVDVVVTLKNEQGLPSSKVLLQNVEVLEVPRPEQTGEIRRSAAPEQSYVTLAVLPAEAEKLSLALSAGALQLLLRGPDDRQPIQTPGVSQDTLLPSQGTLYRAVEVIRGQQRRVERFGDNAERIGTDRTAEETPQRKTEQPEELDR